ncbi:AAA family ATPase [Paracoccus endophyticus]|uniref:AAA family ATPase n=1 Tax=Paracoccus endophyticus TaxID=2233774 RepID=UPI000DD5D547|nr:helicase RepA family protein [Paracoccus endophyticus]
MNAQTPIFPELDISVLELFCALVAADGQKEHLFYTYPDNKQKFREVEKAGLDPYRFYWGKPSDFSAQLTADQLEGRAVSVFPISSEILFTDQDGDPRAYRLAERIPHADLTPTTTYQTSLLGEVFLWRLRGPLSDLGIPSEVRAAWQPEIERYLQSPWFQRLKATIPPEWHETLARRVSLEWFVTAADLAELTGGDDSIIWRGIRAPGFWHRKVQPEKGRDGAAFQVKFNSPENARATLTQLRQGASLFQNKLRKAIMRKRERESRAAVPSGEAGELAAWEYLLQFVPVGNYSTAAKAGFALDEAFGDDAQEIWESWVDENTSLNNPEWGNWKHYEAGLGFIHAVAKNEGADMTQFYDLKKEREKRNAKVSQRKLSLLRLDKIEAPLSSNYVVKGFLGEGELSVMYAAPGSKKTFLALDMALHVTSGTPWFGMRVRKEPGAVVFVAAEGGEGFKRRIAAFKNERPEIAEAALSRFFLYPGVIDLGPGGAGAEELLDAIRRDVNGPVSMIIIDTLARTMGAGDENAQKDMGIYIASADALREETGAHVMIIHHSGKDVSKGALGSSALRGAADTEIELAPDDDVQGLVIIKNTKQRDMAAGRELGFMLHDVDLGRDDDGDPVKSAVVLQYDMTRKPPASVKLAAQHQLALDLLHRLEADADGWSSMSEWDDACEDAGLSQADTRHSRRKAFTRAVAALVKAGRIESNGERVRIVRTPDDDVI